jgi:hypothetical protein
MTMKGGISDDLFVTISSLSENLGLLNPLALFPLKPQTGNRIFRLIIFLSNRAQKVKDLVTLSAPLFFIRLCQDPGPSRIASEEQGGGKAIHPL